MKYPKREPNKEQRLGCFSAGILFLASLVIGVILLQIFGSYLSFFTPIHDFFSLFLLAFVGLLFPSIFLNAMFASLRNRFSRRGAYFGDTFLSVFLLFNVFLFLLLMILFPNTTSKVLNTKGDWSLNASTAKVFNLPSDHVFFQEGKAFVRRFASLLQTENARWKPLLSDFDKEVVPSSQRLRKAKKVSLPSSFTPQKRGTQTIHSVHVKRSGSSMLLNLQIVNETGSFLLDTGASYLSLPPKIARRLGVYPKSDAPHITLRTANGSIRTQIGIIPSLNIGGFELHNVSYVLCESCAQLKRGVWGLLGVNIMNRFRTTLEPKKSLLLLEKGEDFNDQTDDIKPFTRFQSLRGETLKPLFSKHQFKLSGWFKNHSSRKIREITFRLEYLSHSQVKRVRKFKISSMEAFQKKRISFRDVPPQKFQFYRLELDRATW